MAESIVKKLLTKLAASLPKDKLAKFKIGDLFKKKKKSDESVDEEDEKEEGTEVISNDSDKTGEIDVTELREAHESHDNQEVEVAEITSKENEEEQKVEEADVEEAGEEEGEEEEKTAIENKSLLNKIKTKLLTKFNKSKKKSSEDDKTSSKIKTQTKTNFSLPKENRKFNKSKIIQTIVALAIVYFVVDEFILNDQGDTNEVVAPTKTVKPSRKRPQKKIEQPKEQAVEAIPTPENKVTTEVKEEENSATVNIDEHKPESIPTTDPETEVATEPEAPSDQNPSLAEDPTPAAIIESDQIQEVQQSPPSTLNTEPEELNDKVKTKMDNTEVAETEKIRFERAPNYEVLGRGLVYNCEGKHWACIDKEGFARCEMNKKWHESKASKPSCVPFEVYENEADCGKAQQSKVNEAIKTDFCK